MSQPQRYSLALPDISYGMDEDSKGEYVLWKDYAALKRRYQDMLDAIERAGGLDNIRRVEVSQPVVIDMARENALLKGENARLKAEVERLRKAGDAVCESPYALETDPAVIEWRAAREGKPSV